MPHFDPEFDPGDFENEWAGTDRSGFGRYEWSGNRRVYRIVGPWDNQADALTAILGTTELRDGTIVRFKPWSAPDDNSLVAVAADVRGVLYRGQSGDATDPAPERMKAGSKYDRIELAVTFAAVRHLFGDVIDTDTMEEGPITSETDRYCVKRVRRSQETIGGLVGDFVWARDGKPLQFVVPITFGFQEVDVTWLAIPVEAIPVTAINECIRRISNAELSLPSIPPPADYPKGSVLLQAVSEEEMYFPNSSLGVHLTYHFKVLMGFTGDDGGTGWNYLPAQSPADTWKRVARKGMTADQPDSGIYADGDFSKLFQPEPH